MSRVAFGERYCIEFLASNKVNVNKVNMMESYQFNILHVVPIDVHFQYIDNAFICTA